MNEFKGKRCFVYGKGVSGRSALHAVKKRGGRVILCDDDGGKFCPPPDIRYDFAVISPGIRRDHGVYAYCRERKIETVGEVELGFKMADCPIVGVTGTNGKTTVTGLISAMTGGTACGNIGDPITAAVDREHRLLVCELSSFQLCEANISPRVAVITNLAADHIDWHGSLEEYYRCKCNIASHMTGELVLGEDITVGALKHLDTQARIIRCSSTSAVDGAYIEDGYFKFFGERVCPVEYLRLQGVHNIKNALVAIAAAKCVGSDNTRILKAISTAESAPHRIAYVGTADGKRYIDDSKGTNVSACLAAVDAVSGTVCLIVGGRDKALDFGELFRGLPERVVEVVAMGESARSLSDSAADCGYGKTLTIVDGLDAAVIAASRSKAETVLLSPACASFDEFENYGARGDAFAAAVARLRKKNEKSRK